MGKYHRGVGQTQASPELIKSNHFPSSYQRMIPQHCTKSASTHTVNTRVEGCVLSQQHTGFSMSRSSPGRIPLGEGGALTCCLCQNKTKKSD